MKKSSGSVDGAKKGARSNKKGGDAGGSPRDGIIKSNARREKDLEIREARRARRQHVATNVVTPQPQEENEMNYISFPPTPEFCHTCGFSLANLENMLEKGDYKLVNMMSKAIALKDASVLHIDGQRLVVDEDLCKIFLREVGAQLGVNGVYRRPLAIEMEDIFRLEEEIDRIQAMEMRPGKTGSISMTYKQVEEAKTLADLRFVPPGEPDAKGVEELKKRWPAFQQLLEHKLAQELPLPNEFRDWFVELKEEAKEKKCLPYIRDMYGVTIRFGQNGFGAVFGRQEQLEALISLQYRDFNRDVRLFDALQTYCFVMFNVARQREDGRRATEKEQEILGDSAFQRAVASLRKGKGTSAPPSTKQVFAC